MTTKPSLIFNPGKAPSLQLLFLSEGFDDRINFLQCVDGILQELLRVDPFEIASDHLVAWAHFVRSVDGPIVDVERNTAFGCYIVNGNITTLRPQRIVDAISDIQVKIPNVGNWEGRDIWLDRLLPERSIICVLVNTPLPASNTCVAWSIDVLEPPFLTADIQSLLPCVFLSSWALAPGSTVQYTNPHFAVALTLAKQIGVVFGLADELEYSGDEYEQYRTTDPNDPTIVLEPYEPNVTAHASLLNDAGELNIDQLKWKDMVPKKRQGGFLEVPHPIPSSGATEDQIEAMFLDAVEFGDSSVLVIRHPGWSDPTFNVPNTQRYITGPRKPLWLEGQIHLFEGGDGYRRSIYRPSSECLMRFEGYDSSDGVLITRNNVPACKVCREHLRRTISGRGEKAYDPTNTIPAIIPALDRCSEKKESTVAKKLLKYIEENTPKDGVMVRPSGERMACTEATARRVEGVFRDKLRWRLTKRVPSRDWDPDFVALPMLRGVRTSRADARRAWVIWNTKLKPLLKNGRVDEFALSQWNSISYAGLGAAGAVIYLGFACLVNRTVMSTLTISDPALNGGEDIEIVYRDIVPLELSDFTNLQEGSVLQVWKGVGANFNERLAAARETFRNVIAYVEKSRLRREGNPRLIPDDPPTPLQLCGDPDWCGHSLFYVGMDSGTPMVADQDGKRRSLIDGWRKDYPLWIAAQWFE